MDCGKRCKICQIQKRLQQSTHVPGADSQPGLGVEGGGGGGGGGGGVDGGGGGGSNIMPI